MTYSIWSRGSNLRTRILAVALIPSLSLMLVGLSAAVYTGYRGYQATTESGKYSNLDGSSADSGESAVVREFLQSLRDERRLTGELLGDPSLSATALRAQWQKSDRATATVQSISRHVVSAASLDALVDLRPKIAARQVSLVDAVDEYSSVIVEADGRRSTSLSEVVSDPRVIRQDEINKQLAELTETLDVSDTLSFSAFSGAGMPSEALQTYSQQIGDFLTLLTTLQRSLPPDEAAELNRLTAGPDGEVVAVVQRSILRGSLVLPLDDSPARTKQDGAGTERRRAAEPGLRLDDARVQVTLPVPRAEWRSAMAQICSGLVALQRRHLEYSAGIAQDVGQQQLGNALAGSIALVLLAVLVLMVSLTVSRGLISRLQRLREETIELSHTRLPEIVGQLRNGEQVDIDRTMPALHYGSDEIGQVADAFSQAQRTAVTAASNEAELRAGLRKVFLDIAHRSQAIAYRQLKVLDRAERNQEDPDQVELLFQLDHLATRARRNAENLIIMGGAQAGRRWRNPVALLQLIRSAISEAEHYARVRVTAVPDVAVVGGAAADLIHLLAELVDNATHFSPPEAWVEVRGCLVGRGLAIEIEDQGLGIEPGQLERFNEMLHNPPDFQIMALAGEPRLGLFVVARLAAKHGIRVTLTSSTAYGGTMVIVLVPTALLFGEPQQRPTPELVAPPPPGPGHQPCDVEVLAPQPPRVQHSSPGPLYPQHQAPSAPSQTSAPTYRSGEPASGPDDLGAVGRH